MIKYLFLLLSVFSIQVRAETIRAAIIDTGLDMEDVRFKGSLCLTGHKDFIGNDMKDTLGHGTYITGLIMMYAADADYCLLIYKYYSDTWLFNSNLSNEISSISEAIKNGATIINISAGGGSYSDQEYDIIKNNPKIMFIVAAGNDSQDLSDGKHNFYPASYKLPNITAVGVLGTDMKPNPMSNYGTFVKWELGTDILSIYLNNTRATMTGSSAATAVRTGKLLLSRKK